MLNVWIFLPPKKFWWHSSILVSHKYLKNLNFQSFFTYLLRSFGDSIQWKECIHFLKHVTEQGAIIPNISRIVQSFGRAPPFPPQKSSLKVSVLIFFISKKTLVITFNETRAPTSRKYVAEQGLMMSYLFLAIQSFWWYSSVFALGKYLKNLNFHGFFTS